MKLAIVHDALVNLGGAERVVGAFHQMFVDAPIYTTVYLPERTHELFRGADVRSTWLQRVARSENQLKSLFPLTFLAVRNIDLADFEVVLSSSTYCAKNINTDAVHICYCYAPFRPVWEFDEYTLRMNWSRPKRWMMRSVFSAFRQIDFRAGQKPEYLIAISKHSAGKIERAYGRKPAAIIYPPVDVASYSFSSTSKDYFLVVSRLMAYKKIDLVVEVFNDLKIPLKIVGTGPDRNRLRAMARDNVEFLGAVSDAELRDCYAGCRALIFPGEEDFGLTPLEAHASGKPVIAFSQGGALETIIDANAFGCANATGVFFNEQTSSALTAAVRQFEHLSFNPQRIRDRAELFDMPKFRAQISNFVVQARKRHLLRSQQSAASETYVSCGDTN